MARDWHEFLSEISYKPNYTLTWYVAPGEYDMLKVKMVVDDSRNPGQKTTVESTMSLPPFEQYPDEVRLQTVMAIIENLEIHEAREWFRYKGVLVFDPHDDKED